MLPLDGDDIISTLPLGPPGPQGPDGPRGLQGNSGIQGIPGGTGPTGLGTYQDTTTPTSVYGRDGETFIVPTTGDIFKKIGGNWLKTGNLRGPAPETQIDGVRIRFRNPDGVTWTNWINLGEVGPESFSTPVPWAVSTYYTASAPRSTVVYLGETYVTITSHDSGTVFDSTKWQKIAAKGADGATPSVSFDFISLIHFGS